MIGNIYKYYWSGDLIQVVDVKGNKNKIVVCKYLDYDKKNIEHTIEYFTKIINSKHIIEQNGK